MDIVIRKLELRASLSPEEKAALRATFCTTRRFDADQDLLREGEKPPFVGALVSGMLCRYKPLPNGQRQIVSLPLPGDIFDLHSFSIAVMDHSVGAITHATVVSATHAAVEAMTEAHPRLGMLLWRDAVVESSIFREWIVNCGRRNAYQRIAHLFCETYVRMAEVGLAEGGHYELPLTQHQLGDAVGLSVVHVNRVLQQLRADALVQYKSGHVTIPDWHAVATAAGFEPGYLHAMERLAPNGGFAVDSSGKGARRSGAQLHG